MTDLGANILRVVEILEVFGKEQARTEALEIVKTQSRVNFNALDAVMSSRPGYFSTSMIIECFSESSATGDELVAAMRRFRLPPDWVKVTRMSMFFTRGGGFRRWKSVMMQIYARRFRYFTIHWRRRHSLSNS